MPTPLKALAEYGQSAWIDYLSRTVCPRRRSRGRDRGWDRRRDINPTIFQAAIAEGDSYDEQLHEVLAAERDSKEVFLVLAREDIRAAVRPSAAGS